MQFTTKGGRTWDVYGSPVSVMSMTSTISQCCLNQGTPKYALGAFQYDSGSDEAIRICAQIPGSTEILLTHTPPFGIRDVTRRGKNAGCPTLAARLDSGELSHCRLHVYGHIHEDSGFAVKCAAEASCERVSVNAAMPETDQAIIVDLLN